MAAVRMRLQHRTQLESASNGTASCTSCSSSSDRLRSMLREPNNDTQETTSMFGARRDPGE